MSRVAVVVAVAGVAALVAGCGGTGQASRPAAHGGSASLVAKGGPRVCEGLRPVASRIAAMKQPGYGELEQYSAALTALGQRAYQGADANVTVANLLSEAATVMAEAAISRPAKLLAVAQDDVRQAMSLCPAPRTSHARD